MQYPSPLARAALFLAASVAFIVSSTPTARADDSKPPEVKAETSYTLRNGLRVVLHEDHSSPVVAVQILYHVGSKNEKLNRTGFAHLFEHLMFQGSEHNDRDYFEPLQKLGADFNGWTGADMTGYHEVVPSNSLELALWMESDRMGFLLPALTQAKLNKQRDVVKNEIRQGLDQPYGKTWVELSAALFPPGHPYSWTNAGAWGDFDQMVLDDVKDFFRTYYNPNNASLCLVGDFKTDDAKKLIEKYFGGIPPGPLPPRPIAMPFKLDGPKEVKLFDRVELPRLILAWPAVPSYHVDEAPLQILARVMSATNASRLDRNIVYEKQVAQDIGFGVDTREIAGAIMLSSTARAGHTLEEIEKLVDGEIEKIKAKPPTAEEVQRAKNAIEADFVKRLQSALGKAGQFNSYNIFRGTPNYAAQDLERFLKVTQEDVQRVAQKYLTANRLRLTIEPQGNPAPSDSPEAKNVERTKIPAIGPTPSLELPKVQRFKLKNGLEVLAVERRDLPLVNFNLIIKAGSSANTKAGVASMTAALLREGTAKRSKLQLENELELLGLDLHTGAGWDHTGIGMQTLTKHLDRALDIFTDVLLRPAFDKEELERQRKTRLTGLLQARKDPGSILWKSFSRTLYGADSPYGWPEGGTEESLPTMTREELLKFKDTWYRPNNAALIVVGDVNIQTLRAKLEKAFADWKPADVPRLKFPAIKEDPNPTVILGDKPGAAQTMIVLGSLGPARQTPDYFPLVVANAMMGGTYMSRLNLNIRQDKGFAYGAYSWFTFRRNSSPYAAYSAVHTPVTKEAVFEMVKEYAELITTRPITAEELTYAKDTFTRGFVRGFETNGDVAGKLGEIVLHDLPDDYFNRFVERVNAVTLDDIQRVAKQYLDPAKMTLFVVGDRKKIEPWLRELNLGEIKPVDERGRFTNEAATK